MTIILNGFKGQLSSWCNRLQRGQDLTEYALLVAFIAIIVVLAVTFFGESISAFFSETGDSLAEIFN